MPKKKKPLKLDAENVQGLMEKIVLLNEAEMQLLIWRIEEYLREHRFAKTWAQMQKESPLIAEIHKNLAPLVRKVGERMAQRQRRNPTLSGNPKD